MDNPDNNSSSWISDSLLYATDLPPLNQQPDGVYDQNSFHHNLVAGFDDGSVLHHSSPEFRHSPEQQQQQQQQQQQGQRGAANVSVGCAASARKVHKADREKIRRDRLNEQFTELASVLDADRPKNDKATILSDSVQELNELRAEVKRLKADHAALLDESRDLTQEKSELREEKAILKTETEQLQTQLQQRLRLALSWNPMDIIGAAAFPYPLPPPPPPPPPAAATTSSSSQPTPNQTPPNHLMPTPPYLPPFAIHPSLQAYAMFAASRPAGANLPYFPYPHYPPPPPHSHSTVERPFAQYPSPMHPIPMPIRTYGQEQVGESPFKSPVLTSSQASQASQAREDSGQPDSTGSENSAQVEGQEVVANRRREGSCESNCSAEIRKHASVESTCS